MAIFFDQGQPVFAARQKDPEDDVSSVFDSYNVVLMRRLSLSWARFTRAALLVVLVAAQSVAVAHEISHWHNSTQELCATCSFSTNLDGLATVEHQRIAIPCVNHTHVSTTSYFVLVDVQLPYFQRAPPISL
ncbi:MAG TPA: hypothetical protein VJ984_03605 [Xanthomonadales bacterium]|nr:hypothetical protein [Xanthomonadales bacterium]